jgi:hypothetical protein
MAMNLEEHMQKLKNFYSLLPLDERRALLGKLDMPANSFYRILRGTVTPTWPSVKKILKADKRITLEMLGVDDDPT